MKCSTSSLSTGDPPGTHYKILWFVEIRKLKFFLLSSKWTVASINMALLLIFLNLILRYLIILNKRHDRFLSLCMCVSKSRKGAILVTSDFRGYQLSENIMDSIIAVLYFSKTILVGHTQNYPPPPQFPNTSQHIYKYAETNPMIAK